MTDTDVTTQCRRVFAAFDAQDVLALLAFMDDDIELRLGNADTVRGEAAFVGPVNAFFGSVAGVGHEILRVYIDGDARIVEFDVHYTRHDGKAVMLPSCNVFRLRDVLIAEYRSYVDATPMYASGPNPPVGVHSHEETSPGPVTTSAAPSRAVGWPAAFAR